MPTLCSFLQDLVWNGEVRFRERPPARTPANERTEALDLLEQAYHVHRLEVAGPPLAFDRDLALQAGEMVRQACWFLVDRSEPETGIARHLSPLPLPNSPAQHLSADLVLRFVPAIHRRARARSTDDVLTRFLADTLQSWPLSGVLSDVQEAPRAPPDFSGHAGLCLLYAERLARNTKRNWLPGPDGMEVVELVWKEEGRDPALLELLTAVG
jgi:hypothetical protein